MSGDKISIMTMSSRYFQVWNNIDENTVKNLCCSQSSKKNFFLKLFLLTCPGDNFFFSISVILDLIFILSVKKSLTAFQKVLLSAMSLLLILSKKFFFPLLIKLTRRSRCLSYAFLSMSLFVFKNFFLRRALFE